MNNIGSNFKSVVSGFLLIFLLIPFCFATESEEKSVTNRELLTLAIMSYNNNPQEDVSKMGDEKFNAKWFAGYGEASELEGWKIVDYIINEDIKDMDGFSVITYKKDKNVVIAFRGTDSGILRENWEYFIIKEHPQAKHVSNYINKLEKASFIEDDTRIYITGHSLGGYLATFGLGRLLMIDSLKDKLIKTVTFNGLGLGYIKDKHMIETLSKVKSDVLVNYAIKGDVVSIVGKHFTKLVYLKLFSSKNPDTSIPINRNPHFLYSFLAQNPFLKNK